MREGAWGITINPIEYKIYVVWAVSKELTEYTSDAGELRYWGNGVLKSWWASDPETSRRLDDSTTTTSATGSTTDSVNGTALTPWYVATDAAGDIYVTASDETTGGFDRDVFKYDGATGGVIGRFSTCFGGERGTSSERERDRRQEGSSFQVDKLKLRQTLWVFVATRL